MARPKSVVPTSARRASSQRKATVMQSVPRDLSFRYFATKLEPLYSTAHQTFYELIHDLCEADDFHEDLVLRSKDNTSAILLYRFRKNADYITFHVIKIKGDPTDLLGDLKTKSFDLISNSIQDFGSDKGIVRHTILAYDIKSNFLVWQKSKAISIADFIKFFREKYNQNLILTPVINARSEEFFKAMDTQNWELSVTPSSIPELVSLFDLPEDARVSAIGNLLDESNSGHIHIQLSASNDNKKILSRRFIERETLFYRLFHSRNKGKVRMTATGKVNINNELETTVVDLIKGALLFETKIISGKSIEELWMNKEKGIKSAIDYGRNFY